MNINHRQGEPDTDIAEAFAGTVRCGFMRDAPLLPLVLQPATAAIDPGAWSARYVKQLQSLLQEYGAILFRGFVVKEISAFESFIAAVSSERLEYNERSSPRTEVGANVYTSTEYPASESIFLHNENSYQRTWPLRIFFYCSVAPEKGGETPIADCRRIYQGIHSDVRATFLQKQVMYVRNFGSGFGLPWETVFQTNDKREVEAYCRKVGMRFEWNAGNQLRTWQVRPAIAKHPQTGEYVWFNHATFFHITTLDPVLQRVLLSSFKEQNLPNNTYYGDGTPIPSTTLSHLRDIYRRETIVFPWQQGDILMLDNMLVAHGRNPFAGARKVLVAMSEPWSDHGLD